MADKPTRYYSKKQEKRIAQDLGLRRTANSGATDFDKGDAVGKYVMMECKTATKPVKSMSIKKNWLVKNREEMFAKGKEISAVAFDFGDGDDYIILRKSDFKMLLELYRQEREEDE